MPGRVSESGNPAYVAATVVPDEPRSLSTVTEALVAEIRASLSADAVDDAIATAFTGAIGMSPAEVEVMRGSPFWQMVAANLTPRRS